MSIECEVTITSPDILIPVVLPDGYSSNVAAAAPGPENNANCAASSSLQSRLIVPVALVNPGRYVLKTQNLPLISKWVTRFGYGPDSPFRSEVYFIGTKLFPNLKWGTSEPILFIKQK